MSIEIKHAVRVWRYPSIWGMPKGTLRAIAPFDIPQRCTKRETLKVSRTWPKAPGAAEACVPRLVQPTVEARPVEDGVQLSHAM